MNEAQDDVADSQILAEHVGFLDNCFDTSLVLQNSVLAVKEYLAEDEQAKTLDFNGSRSKNSKRLSQNRSVFSDITICNTQVKPTPKDKIISRKLCDWGLPYEIVRKYETKGIKEMFEWQVDCLGNSKVLLDCSNLVYSAPTSAGKTLVAEILTIKTILERQKKVIIILPFVSIVREKMFYLQDILSSSGIRVEGFMGAQSPPGGLAAVHIAICTIEKANSLINRLLDEGTISELGAVIVDELHLLGDQHRGYILELLLTKIKYVSSRIENVQIQIVGMSATLPNLKVLADWLDAELFVTDFRPIPLDEYCLVDKKYFDRQGKLVHTIENTGITTISSDTVLHICLETIKEGCSVLIFCMTKNRCESLSQSISSTFFKLGCSGHEMGAVLREQLKLDRILEVLEQLKSCPVGLDNILKSTISFGVAYHHAGLTFDERDIIEGAFKSGAIRVLVATSTLSSGVNLPARKVIVRTPVFQRQPINILTYKQMIGRAGRMGKDTKGESILICTEAEKKIGFDLMMGALEPVKSCIESEDKFMRAILEMIASEVACVIVELELYAQCTLLFKQDDIPLSQKSLLDNTLDELKNFELVRIQDDENGKRYCATPLGKACLSSSMAPNDGLSLFCELQRARQCLVLETDLHLIYLVTPYSVSSQWGDIDWLHLLTMWESLTKAMKRVGELVGVQESFIIRCVRGTNKLSNAQNKMNIHKRFYTALALQDLVNEMPLSDVAAKFQCARGFLQSLQQAAATFAGMVTVFCHQLGWKNLEMLISQFQDRLHFGIHSELLELMKLPSLNGMRARSIFNAGFETLASIASADSNAVENALIKAVPFQSEKEREDDDTNDVRKRNKIKNVWITGCCGMTTREAAENLIREARIYLEREIGVSAINWSNRDKNETEEEATPKNETVVKNGIITLPTNNHGSEIAGNLESEQVQDVSIPKLHVSLKASEVKELEPTETLCAQGINNGIENVSNCSKKSYIDITDEIKNEVEVNTDMFVFKENVSSVSTPDILKQNVSQNATVSQNKIDNLINSPYRKDDIVWDSLNLSDVPLTNITKIKQMEKTYSPEISFSDNEKVDLDEKITSKSTGDIKDASLFSSEGDNSSLFEDSLPLDSVAGKLIDDNVIESNKEVEINDTNFTINSTSILNAFQTAIDVIESVDDDEDIHLVYEDDIKSYNETEITRKSIIKNNTIKSEILSNGSLHLKRQMNGKEIDCPAVKRIKPNTNNERDAMSHVINLHIDKTLLKCRVTKNEEIANTLRTLLSKESVSLHLQVDNDNKITNEIIGLNILRPKDVHHNIAKENNKIKGISIYCGGDEIIFLDLSSCDKTTYINELERLFNLPRFTMKLLSTKFTYHKLKKYLNIELQNRCYDVGLADWLLDSAEKESSVVYLLDLYCKIKSFPKYQKDSIQEICFMAWAVWKIAEQQEKLLEKQYNDIHKVFDNEVHIAKILATSEYHGITVNKELSSRLLADTKGSQSTLQKKAYAICGHHFNFNSSKDVAKVLGIYRGKKVSTKKSVLCLHNSEMSNIVMYWRKLNSILTKTLYPLTERAVIYGEDDRVNPTYTMFTCSGRVSMHEPNLQNVPRTFTVPYHCLTDAKNPINDVIEFNCRNIFIAKPGYVFVSADYCQLEMRILTHYCMDPVLLKIMRSGMDVFKSVAASWGGVDESDVDDDLRQRAKQLCYGIIYGMGNKTLGQTLDVTEMEAAVFMDTFHKTYPAIRRFTEKVIEGCREKGYIETLMMRRRYLPDVNSKLMFKRSAAERRAVNTTIQGSAADIAKAAMCEIDKQTNHIKDCLRPHLVLQMHDELIYEVHDSHRTSFASTLKRVMENTVTLNVPLPVKVKCGQTWGTLQEMKL